MSDEEDVEDMLKMWGDTDSLTLTGLHVLRRVIDKGHCGALSRE